MKINILGLGETLNHFKEDGNITIGVNDIHSRFKTDYVVCVDHPSVFDSKRFHSIASTKCKGFYSQVNDWREVVKPFNLIEFNNGRGLLHELDNDKFCYSNNSPYVACILAYKLGAKEIVLWGVDFNDHPHINGNSRDKAINDYKELNKEFKKRGVKLVIGHKDSSLFNMINGNHINTN